MDLVRVLEFLSARRAALEPAVLVTVCAVEGSSMRNPGTIMGVAGDGRFEGSLSGGCIENAVVAEALDALKAGAPRVVRFGAGSPYLDIRLLCGGGLDIHFCPLEPGDDWVLEAFRSVAQRQPFSIRLGPDGVSHAQGWSPARFDREHGTGVFGHWPPPSLRIVGHGAGVEALANQAHVLGCLTHSYTPDERIRASLKADGFDTELLTHRTQTDILRGDPWTAFVFLFHDHDWEIELIERALALPHFYLGAMGGRKAHAFRCEALLARGVARERLDTIKAPIGVFHSSRDPQTLALSTLAEVIRAYQAADFRAAIG